MELDPEVMYHGYTLSELQVKAKYYRDKQDNRFREDWERTRAIVHSVLASVGSKKRPSEIMPFPWDAPAEPVKPMSEDEIRSLMAAHKMLN